MVGEKGSLPSSEKVRLISLSEAPREFKVSLLTELGYKVHGDKVLSKEGKPYLDPYSGVEVSIKKMVILPGHSPPVVLDDSPLSLAYYIEEYGDIF